MRDGPSRGEAPTVAHGQPEASTWVSAAAGSREETMADDVRSSDADISEFGPPAAIRRALDLAQAEEAQTLADQIRLCEIAAPTFHEQRRAAVLAEGFRGAHLKDVRIDEAGNVHGRYGEGTRYVVVTAHMD